MSLIPLLVAGALVAGTVALAQLGGLDPLLAGLTAAGFALTLIFSAMVLILARLRNRHRKMILHRIWAVTRRDLADLVNVLTFRR